MNEEFHCTLIQFENGHTKVGLAGQVACQKPYVNKINRGKGLKFAKGMLKKPVDLWKNVVWSIKSKFNLFDSNSKVMVWETPRKEFDLKCTIPSVKNGGGLVMLGAVSQGRELKNCMY